MYSGPSPPPRPCHLPRFLDRIGPRQAPPSFYQPLHLKCPQHRSLSVPSSHTSVCVYLPSSTYSLHYHNIGDARLDSEHERHEEMRPAVLKSASYILSSKPVRHKHPRSGTMTAVPVAPDLCTVRACSTTYIDTEFLPTGGRDDELYEPDL